VKKLPSQSASTGGHGGGSHPGHDEHAFENNTQLHGNVAPSGCHTHPLDAHPGSGVVVVFGQTVVLEVEVPVVVVTHGNGLHGMKYVTNGAPHLKLGGQQ